jgi:hypothetical protein
MRRSREGEEAQAPAVSPIILTITAPANGPAFRAYALRAKRRSYIP